MYKCVQELIPASELKRSFDCSGILVLLWVCLSVGPSLHLWLSVLACTGSVLGEVSCFLFCLLKKTNGDEPLVLWFRILFLPSAFFRSYDHDQTSSSSE